MITPGSPVNGTIPTSSTIAQSAVPASPNIDFQNFLKLLTAQLRNQDPLSPADSTQFVSQLASFSTVEQLVNANSKLDRIGDRISGDKLSTFASWIGKNAELNSFISDITAPAQFRIEHDQNAQNVELVARDSTGDEVARISIENSGVVQTWPGLVLPQTGAGGRFTFEAEYFSGGNLINKGEATIFSRVTSVREASGRIEIELDNGGVVGASEIIGLSQ